MSSRTDRYGQRRRWRGLVWLLVLTAFTVGATGALYVVAGGSDGPDVPPGRPVTLTIEEGEGSGQIARALEASGVVESSGGFRALAAERGLDASLKPGTYALVTGMDPGEVLEILAQGPDPENQLTIPEGFTVDQIAARMAKDAGFDKDAVAKALKDPALIAPYRPDGVKTLEGLLFPQTYPVTKDATPVSLLQAMLDQLQAVLSGYDLEAAPRDLSPYEVLVVASMVEREAKVPEDRPKIARVIYNRLEKGMRLQIDATVRYALDKDDGGLTNEDLAVDSPYNTYQREGLPPTPIASPGEASIKAALQPADGDWLYYVIKDKNGAHAFTSDYDEHLRLKAEARAKGLL